jgi:hypothetical protein
VILMPALSASIEDQYRSAEDRVWTGQSLVGVADRAAGNWPIAHAERRRLSRCFYGTPYRSARGRDDDA